MDQSIAFDKIKHNLLLEKLYIQHISTNFGEKRNELFFQLLE